MTEARVIRELGVDPYDITYNMLENTKILVWNYKRPYHEISRKLKGSKSALTSGSERYQDDLKLYAHFKDGTLIYDTKPSSPQPMRQNRIALVERRKPDFGWMIF